MKTISFIIPVYNEEKRLAKTFKALRELKLPKSLNLESVIFVDDGSTDNSKLLIRKASLLIGAILKTNIKLISYPQNKGKGFAIKQGLLYASSDYTFFFDADISTPLWEVSKFLPYFKDDIDLVVGTRKTQGSEVIIHQSHLREFLGQAFTLFTKIFLGLKVSDITCGFKAISRRAAAIIAPQLKINGWGYDAELFFLTQKEGFKSMEVPVIWSNDPNSRVKIKEAVITTLKELFTIRWEYSVKPGLLAYPRFLSLAFTRLASIFL